MDVTKSFLLVFFLSFGNFRYFLTQTVSPQYLDSLLETEAYKHFIDILQIPNDVDYVDPTQRKTDYVQQFFYNGIRLGDIILRHGQLLNPSQLKKFDGHLHISINKWDNGTVPYYISQNTFTDEEKQFILKEIEKNNFLLSPNVIFRPYQSQDKDYVYIFNGGCAWYTNLGRVGGAQVISMTQPFVPGFLIHVFYHVIGFAHQHNRYDRDEYIKIIPKNINQVMKPQYIKYTSESLINWGPFDYYSLTHYPVVSPGHDFSAFDVLQGGIDNDKIATNVSLKDSDIRRVKNVYLYNPTS